MTVVLVVDDEPLVRMSAVLSFEDAGFEVIEAGNSAEALAVLADHPEVTTLLTDMHMPGILDGFALAFKISEARPDVALFITSGQARPIPGELPSGACFIPKPYNGTAVARMIGFH